MKIIDPLDKQDVDEFSIFIITDLEKLHAKHHLLTNGSSGVNGLPSEWEVQTADKNITIIHK